MSVRLGAVNAALVSLYFAPAWGLQALRALTSRRAGLDDATQAAAAGYVGALLDLDFAGMVHAANVLAGIRFVVAVAFFAYLVDFVRALAMRRAPDRATLDAVLVLAPCAIMLFAGPAFASGDAGLIRLSASEFILLTGAMIVIAAERHLDESAHARAAVSSGTAASAAPA
jgi:hypothetical protein